MIPMTIKARPIKSNSRACCLRDFFGPIGGLTLRKKRRAAATAPVGLWSRVSGDPKTVLFVNTTVNYAYRLMKKHLKKES